MQSTASASASMLMARRWARRWSAVAGRYLSVLTPSGMRFRARLTAKGLSAPVVREKSTKVYGDELAVH